MQSDGNFLKELFHNRHLVLQLTLRDFRARFVGSMLGIVWAFLQPLAMMAILWFVFSFGLKARPVQGGVGFVPWYFSANVAWLFFQDGIMTSSNAISEYSFLVKKVAFRVRLLPVVKIFSALLMHAVFLIILVVILCFTGSTPEWHWLQLPYYSLCAFALVLGTGWLLAALNVFTKDVGQLVGIIMQFGFWLTPIIWNASSLPAKYQPLLELNPVFYITEGYRNTFVYHLPLAAQGGRSSLLFWGITATMLVAGHAVFKRMRPHFADVL